MLAYAGISSVDQYLWHSCLMGWSKAWHNSYRRHTYLIKVWMYQSQVQAPWKRKLCATQAKPICPLKICILISNKSLIYPVSQQLYFLFQTQSKSYSAISLAEKSPSSISGVRWSTVSVLCKNVICNNVSWCHVTQDVLLRDLCAWVILHIQGSLRELLKMICWRSKPEPIARWTFLFRCRDWLQSVCEDHFSFAFSKVRLHKCYLLLKLAYKKLNII